jgi:two-component system, NtrC family, response regulator AtoC
MTTLIDPDVNRTNEPNLNGRRSSVAVVDDDPGFSGYLETFLALRGYDARVYTRGDEILAALRHGEAPDVVLLDVAMPGMDGLETLKSLKAARPELQVIMLSGREQAATIVEAVRLGAADYVVKPDDPEGLGDIALEAAIANTVERSRLVTEVSDLRRQLSTETSEAFIGWGESPAMRQVARIIEQVADSDVTVLIRGESGVGKELVARAVHQRSTRREKPFVKVNCAALPAELLESELFGHERGAFTGATFARTGKFEQADRGTIFLDEIGELPPALQAKLLHVLQDAEFTKLGSNKRIIVDVRVVAATNRDLEAMMHAGQFREDLYYRLKVIEAYVPPLRERLDELPQLIEFFVAQYSQRYNRPVQGLSSELQQLLLTYDWPGNVRELENMIKRFVILQDERLVREELTKPRTRPRQETASGDAALAKPDAPEARGATSPATVVEDGEPGVARETTSAGTRRLADLARAAALAAERAVIADTLQRVHWNRRKAAKMLGVSYKTLLNKIKETGVQPVHAGSAV